MKIKQGYIVDESLRKAEVIDNFLKKEMAGKEVKKIQIALMFKLPYNQRALIYQILENKGYANFHNHIVVPLS